MNRRINEYLKEGVTLITPTQRLSRHLRYQFAAYQAGRGETVWETPDCLPWSAWCKRAFRQLSSHFDDDFILLEPSQQQCLWQEIIGGSEYKDQFLQVAATARQAVLDYRLCREWRVPVFPEDICLSEDSRAFKSWYEAYEARRQADGFLDEDCLPDYLNSNIVKKNVCFGKLAFYGFDAMTTQQEHLINALRQAGNDIVDIDPQPCKATIAVGAQRDNYSECLAAACWARKRLQAHPCETIGIISPNLGAIRNDVERAFQAVLDPEQLLRFGASGQKIYSVSLGRPLMDFPLIHTALGLLSLGGGSIPLNTLSRLLHSVFIKGADIERSQRANFDALLRQIGERRLSVRLLYDLHERRCQIHQRCEGFIGLLKQSGALIKGAKTKSPGQWVVSFSDYLSAWGWPGERSLNSDEYQILMAWRQVLIQLGGFDYVNKKLRFNEALSYLKQLLADTHFQPETAETPIQVLGMAAAAAMRFDRLWILGMSEDNWPNPVSVNAFVPPICRRRYRIPSADAVTQLQQAQEITDNLLSSSGEIILSYARREDDRECRPSPLIRPYLDKALSDVMEDYQDYHKTFLASAVLEYFTDNQAPAVPVGRLAAGGSALFKDQAACPFRAFARHRLYARTLAKADIGPDMMTRGNLVHRALQLLWREIECSASLLEQSHTEFERLIRDAVTGAIQQQRRQKPETFGQRFIELEQERLERLLKDWLALEYKRPKFRAFSLEEKETVKFADMEFDLRMDRVDELADGRCVIIDYKTGKISRNDWESDRPSEPQLPLYAVTCKRPVAAIAFACLKRGDPGFVGLGEDRDILPDIKSDGVSSWQQQLKDWERVLLKLARDYRTGVAAIDPVRTACRYCDLHALCRINERIDNPAVFNDGEGKSV